MPVQPHLVPFVREWHMLFLMRGTQHVAGTISNVHLRLTRRWPHQPAAPVDLVWCQPVPWGHVCCTSAIMTLWPIHTSIHDVTPKYPKPAESRRHSICNLFSWNTSHSHDNLRRVSQSPLLHPFTCRRSSTSDWCVTRATSSDSSRLIHLFLAHSSTLCYLSIFHRHRTCGSDVISWWFSTCFIDFPMIPGYLWF
jgi:hypothetical protein